MKQDDGDVEHSSARLGYTPSRLPVQVLLKYKCKVSFLMSGRVQVGSSHLIISPAVCGVEIVAAEMEGQCQDAGQGK